MSDQPQIGDIYDDTYRENVYYEIVSELDYQGVCCAKEFRPDGSWINRYITPSLDLYSKRIPLPDFPVKGPGYCYIMDKDGEFCDWDEAVFYLNYYEAPWRRCHDKTLLTAAEKFPKT